MNKKHKIFCILGESGSGKDTLTTALSINYDLNLKKVISYTTRPKRENETDGVEHLFVNNEEYDKIHNTNKIVAETQIGEYRYMATEDQLLKSDIYIIDPEGLKNLKKNIEILGIDVELISIYIYVPFNERRFRVTSMRKDDESVFDKRSISESEQFDDFRINRQYDYIVFNKTSENGFKHAVDEMFMITEYEGIRRI